MSMLMNDLKKALKDGRAGRYPCTEDLIDSVNAKFVVFSKIVDSTRWGYIVDDIVTRNGSEEGLNYVRIRYEVSSGDGDADFNPEFTDVIPYEVTSTDWREKL